LAHHSAKGTYIYYLYLLLGLILRFNFNCTLSV